MHYQTVIDYPSPSKMLMSYGIQGLIQFKFNIINRLLLYIIYGVLPEKLSRKEGSAKTQGNYW